MRCSSLFLWSTSLTSVVALGEITSLPQSGNISLGDYRVQWSKIDSTDVSSLNIAPTDVVITTETINTTLPVMDPYTRITTCDNGVEPTSLATTYGLHNHSLTWNYTSSGTPQTLATVNATTWSRASAQPRASLFTSMGFSQRTTYAKSLSVGLSYFLGVWIAV